MNRSVRTFYALLLTVNTDDPEMVGTSLTREYQQLVDVFGYESADVIRIARNAFLACFAEADLKSRLLVEFDQWAAAAAKSGE
jgi:adenosine deaminase